MGLLSATLFAKVHVVTTYPYLGEIVKQVGEGQVSVIVLANPKFDPHFIVPRPSLITKLRKADLLVINGGQLEIGWLPPLLRSAQNAKINVGTKGFLDVSGVIDMLDKPEKVSRAMGDVHPDGNPHFSLDPHNIGKIAQVIAAKLSQIDPANSGFYKTRLASFLEKWQNYLQKFDTKMAQCKTTKVVQYHELYNYFLKRYGIESIGNIEPLPGIAPSSKHTIELINRIKQNGVKKILQDVYHEKKTAKFIAAKTGAEVVVIPHDVGAVKGSETLEDFYNTIAERLCK